MQRVHSTWIVAVTCVACSSGAPDGSRSLTPRTDAQYAADLYHLLLDRAPTLEEQEATVAEIGAAPHRMVVHDQILDRAEFAERIDDVTFLVGVYEQVRGRAPLQHEILIARAALDEGVPRSMIFEKVLTPATPQEQLEAPVYDPDAELILDFGKDGTQRFQERARELIVDLDAVKKALAAEAAELGGLLPGAADLGSERVEAAADPIFNVYHGYLHAHTAISWDAKVQGSEGPYAAYAHARDVAGLDFLGLSDHAEFISIASWNNEWQRLDAAADFFNEDGTFVALRGFEYSNPLYGHWNVFGTNGFITAYLALTPEQFYGWLAFHPNAAATFNHPGVYDSYLNDEFRHYQYFPAVKNQMVGIELLTHGDDYDTYSVGYDAEDSLGHLDEALHKGWRLGSVSSQDNHNGNWGNSDPYRTGVLAEALTRADLLNAIRKRRFFSTQDKNLEMSFRANGKEMGSVLGPGGKTFTVTLSDGNGEGFSQIELYQDGAVIDTLSVSGSGSWQFVVSAPSEDAYYYVMATQTDGQRAMSAPIWVSGS